MRGSWRYRLVAIIGTVVLTAISVALVNNGEAQTAVTKVPVISRLPTDPPHGRELVFEILTATVAFVIAMVPLYKPRPRRILDTVSLAQKRTLLAVIALAAVGYFDYTYRLPRLTVLMVTPVLLIALPTWFVYIRRRPSGDSRRAIVIGDDPEQMVRSCREVDIPLFGYLSPTQVPAIESGEPSRITETNGGRIIGRLGGLSRIEDVLVDYDIDTAILAFKSADRAEFFGALDACYKHGVAAKVHRKHANSVLCSGEMVGTFVDVEIEPWDFQDYVVKRVFDVAFSAVGLLVLTPVMALIALAIKVDTGGPLLYRQKRTAIFGETFSVWKFRTMDLEGEMPEPVDDEDNNRITRVGKGLRRTHLDEIPQLWSIFLGDMSVVGPRAVWTEEESLLEADSAMWRKRWFVKPGLTGLAQIHDVKSTDPDMKLRLDLEYVRRQSFWYDFKIVIRQFWDIGTEVLETFRTDDRGR